MAEAIVIRVSLDPSDIPQAGKQIARQLQSALDSSVSAAQGTGKRIGDALSAGMDQAIEQARKLRRILDDMGPSANRPEQAQALRAIKDTEAETVKLAQARARLQSVNGDLAGAERTLSTAIAGTTKETLTTINAQTQLARIQNTSSQGWLRYSSVVREAGESLQNAGAFFSSLSRGLIDIGRSSIEAAGKVESIKRAFGLLDKDQSGATLDRLRKQADDLKVSFISYAEAVNRVRQTQKLTADQSEKLVQGLINVGRAAGVSREAQERAVTALNQILGKGKIAAEELRGQLLEAIPNLGPIIEQRFGSLDAEVLEKKFGAKKFVAGLIEEFGKLQKLEPTGLEKFQVSLENLQIKLAPVGEKVLEFLNKNIEPLSKAVESLIDRFNSMSPASQELAIKMTFLGVALGPVLQGFGALVQTAGGIGNLIQILARLGGTTTGVAGATSGLSGVLAGALNPAVLGVAAAAIGGTITWFKYKEEVNKSIAAIETASLNARRAAGDIDFLNSKKITTNTPTVSGLQVTQLTGPDVTDKINFQGGSKFGQFVGGLGIDQTGRLKKTADAIEELNKAKEKLTGDRRNTGGATAKTVEESLLMRLTKQSEEARLAIEQLQDTTSKEFALRIKIDEKQEFKRDLEEVIKLRRELGEPVTAPLPVDDKAAKAMIEDLRNLRTVSETIKKLDPLSVFREANITGLKAQTEAFNALHDSILSKSPDLREATIEEATAKQLLTEKYAALTDAQKTLLLGQAREIDATRQQAEADETFAALRDQLNGQLGKTEGLTRAQSLAVDLQTEKYRNLSDAQRESLLQLAQQVDANDAIKTQYQEAQRAAQQLQQTIGGLFQTLLESGPKAFFGSLISLVKRSLAQILASIASSGIARALGGLFGFGGGSGSQSSGGFSLGSFFSSILGNRQQAGTTAGFVGAASALPSFAANSPAAKPLLDKIFGASGGGDGFASALERISSGGVSVPPSITSNQLLASGAKSGLLDKFLFGGASGRGASAAGDFSQVGGFLGKFLGGGAVSLLPAFLGAGLGAGLGGQSRLGQIIGGAGGAAVGLGVAFGASVFGAGGGLLAASLAALGPAALIGAPLLIGALLLGRAKQRRTDEASSGDFLTDAINHIREVRDQVKADQVTLSVSQARDLLEKQIIAPFIAQINTLKTRSVRESRLAHQVPDLRALFEKEVFAEIEAQKLRIKEGAFGGRKIIPEFAQSGVVPGLYRGFDDTLVMAHAGEMFLNRYHQDAIARIAGPDVFSRIGVPGAGQIPQPTAAPQSFGFSGVVQPSANVASGDGTREFTFYITPPGISEDYAVTVLETGTRGARGQGVLVKAVKAQRSVGAFR